MPPISKLLNHTILPFLQAVRNILRVATVHIAYLKRATASDYLKAVP